jgi:hypothetical protein
MNPIVLCSCGRAYTALTWLFLRCIGRQTFEWGEVIELANCPCGSTRAVTIQSGEWDESELDPRDPDLAVRALMRRVA